MDRLRRDEGGVVTEQKRNKGADIGARVADSLQRNLFHGVLVVLGGEFAPQLDAVGLGERADDVHPDPVSPPLQRGDFRHAPDGFLAPA
jgi:hypothetical protein